MKIIKYLLIATSLLVCNNVYCMEQNKNTSKLELAEQSKIKVANYTHDKVINEMKTLLTNNSIKTSTMTTHGYTKFANRDIAAFSKELLKRLIKDNDNKQINNEDFKIFNKIMSLLDNENLEKASLVINQMLQISREQSGKARISFSTLDTYNIGQLWYNTVPETFMHNTSFADEVVLAYIWSYINTSMQVSPKFANETLHKMLNVTINNNIDLYNQLKELNFKEYYNNKLEYKIKNHPGISHDKRDEILKIYRNGEIKNASKEMMEEFNEAQKELQDINLPYILPHIALVINELFANK